MKKTFVWAHRGASAYAPENTLEAFRMAVDCKADGIELDVQKTKDGKLVVIHDEKLDRVSRASGLVKDFTYEKLKDINVNERFPKLGTQYIPTLEEVYELIRPTNLTVNVELKTGVIFYPEIEEQVLELTKQMGMQERVIYSSFNHYTIRKIKRLQPDAVTGLLYQDGMIDVFTYAKQTVQADALHPAIYNVQYPDFYAKCRKHGLKVHVWTVNEEEHMRLLCENETDAMITNDPKLGRAVADEYEDGKLIPELVRELEKII
ncbi:Glycerophosphodiester phosphodiesterase [Eubacterium plexicaudatum ASF492]|uniref:GP-PDE domain-containing protein n=1 Tax=Eubacterium plexicaudatum ASF492 TaxID=1235802 RepID=N2A3E9_9FIRM|nr:Glycerophosphodiester phosphodiesterase [Eubacterium plexicaudatum ASF492]